MSKEPSSKPDSPIDFYEDQSELLQDIYNELSQIRDILDEGSDSNDDEKDLSFVKQEILNQLNEIKKHIIQDSPEPKVRLQHKSSSVPLFLSIILILTFSFSIYSLSTLISLNKQWQRQIEEKVDELSTLNQIIENYKQAHGGN